MTGRALAWLLILYVIAACSEKLPGTVSVEDSQLLFIPEAGNVNVPRGLSRERTAAWSLVRFNQQVLTASLNTPFVLQLSDQARFDVVFVQRLTHPGGEVSINGFLSNLGKDYPVLLTINNALVFGRIYTPSGVFRVITENDQVLLLDINRAGLVAAGSRNDQKISTAALPTIKPFSTLQKVTPRSSHLSMIDVLLLYSTGMETRFTPAELRTRLVSLFNQANSALAESQIQLRFRLVHSAPVVYPDINGNDAALIDLTAGVAGFQSVNALRNQYGADLVAFIRPFINDGTNSCGAAWLNGANGSPLTADLAYSVISDGQDGQYYCDDLTLAHELGHSLGSSHDNINAEGIGHFPYSYGYGVGGRFGTVMSYITPQSGKYSNPRISSCFGNPCGVADQADNTLSMNATRMTVEAFRNSTSVIKGLPTAQTLAATLVTKTSADIHATMTTGNLATDVVFEYGLTQGNPDQVTLAQSVAADVVSQDITSSLSDLLCGTTYYYRVVVTNTDGSATGNDLSFTTQSCDLPPVLALPAATETGQTSVTFNVRVTNVIGSDEVFFEFGTQDKFDRTTSPQTNVSNANFSQAVTGLVCGTRYQLRAAVRRDVSLTRSDSVEFETAPCTPGSAVAIVTTGVEGVGQTGLTMIASLNPLAVTAQVYFQYGVSVVDEAQTRSEIVTSPNAVLEVRRFVSGLKCDTVYQYRAAANISGATHYGDTKTVMTNPCVISNALLETLDPEILSATSANFRATVDPSGLPTRVYFEYGVGEVMDMTTPEYSVGDGHVPRSFSWRVSDLQCGTSYRYRAMAISSPSTGAEDVLNAGAILQFVTPACQAVKVVSTSIWATNQGASIDIIVDTSGVTTEFYLDYGDSDVMSQRTQVYSVQSGTVHIQLTQLQCNTVYYFRIVASNTNGGLLGEQNSFSTQACATPPVVVTEPAVDIAGQQATLVARVQPSGSSTSAYFEYGADGRFSQRTLPEDMGLGVVDQFMRHQLSSLACNTRYEYRVIAANEHGNVRGDNLSFVTGACSELNPLPVSSRERLLAANGNYSVVIGNEGSVIAWGENTAGQLGIDDGNGSRFIGVQNAQGDTLSGVVKVAAGKEHVLALLADSSLLAWGNNSAGQLGNAQRESSTRPVAVSNGNFGQLFSVVDIDAGARHSIALLADGSVRSWGDNGEGQLGNGDKDDSSVPVKINLPQKAVSICAGDSHSVVVDSDGRVLAWGDNRLGQLGIGNTASRLQASEVLLPVTAVKVFCGDNFTFALDDQGQLWSWGDNSFGQLALGDRISRLEPNPVSLNGFTSKVNQLAPGHGHVLALLEDNTLLVWGDNSQGQLARPTAELDVSVVPLAVELSADELLNDIAAIAAGHLHSIALSNSGSLLAWGQGDKGQLGAGRGFTGSQTPLAVIDSGGISVSLKVPRILVLSDQFDIVEKEELAIEVRLSSAPAQAINVFARLSGDEDFEVTSSASLTFTPDDWDVAQQLTVRFNEDKDRLAGQATLILQADGYIERKVKLFEKDKFPFPSPPPVGGLSGWLMLMFSIMMLIRLRSTMSARC